MSNQKTVKKTATKKPTTKKASSEKVSFQFIKVVSEMSVDEQLAGHSKNIETLFNLSQNITANIDLSASDKEITAVSARLSVIQAKIMLISTIVANLKATKTMSKSEVNQ